MALKKCKECGKQVSTSAKQCPNCGVKNPTQSTLLNVLSTIIGLLFLGWLCSTFGSNDVNNNINAAADRFSKVSLNVRSGPSTNHEALTALKPGEQLRVIKDSLGWIKISSLDDKTVGWVSKKYTTSISEFNNWQTEQEKVRESQQENRERQAEIVTRQEKIERQFSLWDGSHRNLEDYIQKNMNDPDSYEHVETVYWDQSDHLVVRTTFRGNNAFGGKVKDFVKAKVSLDGEVLEILSQ